MHARTAITISGTVAIILAILTARGAAQGHAEGFAAVHVSVYFRIDQSVRSRVIPEYVKHETANLWAPYGVQIEWMDEPAADAAAAISPLQVRVERWIEGPAATAAPRVLGQVSVGVDAPGRQPILVSVDAIDRVLALRSNRPYSIRSELSRALGRVLAHEIGHVLLGPPYHDDEGLMRRAFRPNELADPDRTNFRLTCHAVNRLRHRIPVMVEDLQFAWTAGGPADSLEDAARHRLDAAPCLADRTRRWAES